MINVLDRFKEDEHFIKCFSTMERDVIEAIRLAEITKSMVVIKRSLLARFKKIDKTIKSKNIYTFNQALSEIFEPQHPINKVIDESLMEKLKDLNNLLSDTESLISVISFRTIRNALINPNTYKFEKGESIIQPILTGVLHGNISVDKEELAETVFHRTQQIIEQHGLNTTTYKIYQFYMLALSRSKHPAREIGMAYSKNAFEKNLRAAINHVIHVSDEDYDEFDFGTPDEQQQNHPALFGILAQIAEMNSKQLHLFINDHYTAIPYFRDLESPKTIITIQNDMMKNVYIKGRNGITELEFCTYRSSQGEYELRHYPYGSDSITLLGYEFELTPDVFEGASLQLFNMVAFDHKKVTIIESPVIDYEAFRQEALNTGDSRDELMKHLQDRVGMFKRKDNRRI